MADDAPNTPVSKRVAAAPAQRETGYVAPGQSGAWWFNDDQAEETPELRWPLSVKVYDRMRRQDFKVKSVMRAVKSPLLSTTWRLDPGASDPEVYGFVSRELGLPVRGVEDEKQATHTSRTRGRFSWQEHLRLALLMLDFGHMAFEQVYLLDEQTGVLHLRKLGPRFPSTISKFDVARDGGLNGIRQHAPGLVATPTLGPFMPVNRIVVYVHEREGADWWGQSLLRAAYMPWMIKARLLRVDLQSIERNGMGIPVHELEKRDPGAQVDTDAEQASIDAGLEIAKAVRAGDNSGASLSPGARLKLLGVEGKIPDAIRSAQYHDDAIGTAVLAHFLNLGRQTGSWALGTTFQDFFVSSLNGIGRAVADVATQHIVEDLVDLNFGPEVPAPRVIYDDLAGQDQALAYAIKALVDAGVLSPDQSLEAYLRAAYKLPQHTGDNTTPDQTTGDTE